MPEKPQRQKYTHSFLVLVDYPGNLAAPYWVWLTHVRKVQYGYSLWYARTQTETFRAPEKNELSCLKLVWPIFA